MLLALRPYQQKGIDDLRACRLCAEEKPLTDFYFRKETGRFRTDCKACMDSKNKAWHRNNPEARKAHVKKWSVKNPEARKRAKAVYRANNPIGYRKWSLENPELKKEINRKWKQSNKGKVAAYTCKRRAARLSATPAWADHDLIFSMYQEAQYFGMEVDHIVPLIHPLVCGLHVESNLRLLSARQNRLKSNKFTPGTYEIHLATIPE